MSLTRNAYQKVWHATFLGALALVINLFSEAFSLPLRLGDLFVLISAGALGLHGALISTAIGIMPHAFWAGAPLLFVRLALISLAVGTVAERFPRIPAFTVTLALWILIFGPFSAFSTMVTVPPHELVLVALSDVLLTVVSGSCLLNSTVWTQISGKPRKVGTYELLIHVLTLVSTLSMFGLLAVTGSSLTVLQGSSVGGGTYMLVGLIVLGVAIPAVVGWRLSLLIQKNLQELFSDDILSGHSHRGFSGLASDYWRRKRTHVDSDGFKRPDSSTQNALPPGIERRLVTPDQGIVALTRDGTITFSNRLFKILANVQLNDIIGKKLDQVGVDPRILSHIQELVENSFNRGPRVTELKLNELPDKLRFFEIATVTPSTSDSAVGGSPDGLIVTIKDITDRRTVESHLLQAQRVGSLGNLVSGVAHAFNNTLTTIIGQASFARHVTSKTETDKCLDEIVHSAQSAGALVRKLIDFAEGKPSQISAIDLRKVVDDRIELIRQLVGVDYEITLKKSDQPLGVRCDTNLLMQVLTNLVLNAKEAYSEDKGKIFISLEREHMDAAVFDLHMGARPGDFVRLRVRDEGFGMTPETLSRAFDPLFSTKNSNGHTGLGLSIVYAIVRAHDGFLTAESYPEKGTSISIYLPLQDLEREMASSLETEVTSDNGADTIATMQGNAEQVLVVEDDENVRKLVSMMLVTLGYKPSSCTNGREALERCKKEQFDLVLVDMIMPKMHGLEFISKIRETNPQTKALLMTGYGVTVEATDVTSDIITKPFDLETLAKAVKNCLGTTCTASHYRAEEKGNGRAG